MRSTLAAYSEAEMEREVRPGGPDGIFARDDAPLGRGIRRA
jgi:hypothetical protein